MCSASVAALENGGVFDSMFKLRVILNLRVIDVSEFPKPPNGYAITPL